MKIEKLSQNELSQIAGLQQELWKFESQFNKEFKVNKNSGRHLIKWLKNMTKHSKSICFVARDNKNSRRVFESQSRARAYNNNVRDRNNGKLVGFVTGWIYTKQRTLYKHRKVGYGCDLYVMPKFRGRGLGRLLMRKLIAWFRQHNVKYIEIEIYQNNKRSFDLNHGLGFKDLATRLAMELK